MAINDTTKRVRVSSGRIGLLLTAFMMLGLIGVFATYAAPIPAMRGLLIQTTLLKAIAAQNPTQIESAMQQAKPMLGIRSLHQFATLKPTEQGALATAILLQHDSAAGSRLVSYRLRLEVIVIGVVAALFGVALLGIGDASPQPPASSAPRAPGDDQPGIMQS
jgi:hypothetical protein